MPLHKGDNKKAIAYNIHELTHGKKRSHDQIVAIALSMAKGKK